MSKSNYFPTILVVLMLIAGFTTGTNAADWNTMFNSETASSNVRKTTTSSTVESAPETCKIRLNTKAGEPVEGDVPVDTAISGDIESEADYINKVTLLSKDCECIGTLVSEPAYKTLYTPFKLDKNGCVIKTSYFARSIFLFCTKTELVKKL
jgi:hypothetical protein